jgi:hypothetical protein
MSIFRTCSDPRPAHTCARRAGVGNNGVWRGAGNLRALVSQIKLSHVGYVTWNTLATPQLIQCPPPGTPTTFSVAGILRMLAIVFGL